MNTLDSGRLFLLLLPPGHPTCAVRTQLPAALLSVTPGAGRKRQLCEAGGKVPARTSCSPGPCSASAEQPSRRAATERLGMGAAGPGGMLAALPVGIMASSLDQPSGSKSC